MSADPRSPGVDVAPKSGADDRAAGEGVRLEQRPRAGRPHLDEREVAAQRTAQCACGCGGRVRGDRRRRPQCGPLAVRREERIQRAARVAPRRNAQRAVLLRHGVGVLRKERRLRDSSGVEHGPHLRAVELVRAGLTPPRAKLLRQAGELGRVHIADRDARRPGTHRAEELRRTLVADGGRDKVREDRIGHALSQRRYVAGDGRQVGKRDRAGRTDLSPDAPSAERRNTDNDKLFFHL